MKMKMTMIKPGCVDKAELFFPLRDVYVPADVAEAKNICKTCPLIVECLTRGRKEPWGIWGGTTPDERGFVGFKIPDEEET